MAIGHIRAQRESIFLVLISVASLRAVIASAAYSRCALTTWSVSYYRIGQD